MLRDDDDRSGTEQRNCVTRVSSLRDQLPFQVQASMVVLPNDCHHPCIRIGVIVNGPSPVLGRHYSVRATAWPRAASSQPLSSAASKGPDVNESATMLRGKQRSWDAAMPIRRALPGAWRNATALISNAWGGDPRASICVHQSACINLRA